MNGRAYDTERLSLNHLVKRLNSSTATPVGSHASVATSFGDSGCTGNFEGRYWVLEKPFESESTAGIQEQVEVLFQARGFDLS